MAFVHCHNCDWQQDDFWDFGFRKYGYFMKWGYNPFSLFLSYVFGRGGYWRPRRIDHDDWCAKELGWSRRDPHSWWLIWWQLKRVVRKFVTQEWWTWNEYKKDPDKYCPDCGNEGLCID